MAVCDGGGILCGGEASLQVAREAMTSVGQGVERPLNAPSHGQGLEAFRVLVACGRLDLDPVRRRGLCHAGAGRVAIHLDAFGFQPSGAARSSNKPAAAVSRALAAVTGVASTRPSEQVSTRRSMPFPFLLPSTPRHPACRPDALRVHDGRGGVRGCARVGLARAASARLPHRPTDRRPGSGDARSAQSSRDRTSRAGAAKDSRPSPDTSRHRRSHRGRPSTSNTPTSSALTWPSPHPSNRSHNADRHSCIDREPHRRLHLGRQRILITFRSNSL